MSHAADLDQFKKLFFEMRRREGMAIRLLGLGVHFQDDDDHLASQGSLL